MFASNETHFFDAVPKNAISGGFLARTFCVYEEKRNTVNSLTRPITKKIDYLTILTHFKMISELKGEIVPNGNALVMFNDWYHPFTEKNSNNDEDDTGTSERIGDGIWKVAMLLSLIDSTDMIITEKHMEESIYQCMITYGNLKRLLMGGAGSGAQKDLKATTMRTVVAMMLEAAPSYKVERKRVLQKAAGVFSVYDLDECIEHLLQAGMIKKETSGSNTYYKLTDMIIRKHLGE